MDNLSQLDELRQLLAQRIGLRVPPDAHDRFDVMMRERATCLGYSTLKEYGIFLAGNKAADEWEEIVRTFTSVETFFFRDHGQFDLLRLRLLPELIKRHRDDKTLRLWSAGCASGEEAYSLAMLVDMLLPQRSDWNILIVGSDIDSRAIAKARQGRYGQWSFRMFPATLQQRYFHVDGEPDQMRDTASHAPYSATRTPHSFLLDERIRKMVTFKVGNLVGDPFPDSGLYLHNMDLILCRNVFIYFDSAAVSAVATKIAATLVEKGYLMTAHTELIGHTLQGLESRLFTEGVVYQRLVGSTACSVVESVPEPSLLRERSADRTQAAKEQETRPVSTMPCDEMRDDEADERVIPGLSQIPDSAIALCALAREHVDRGEYTLAARLCHEALIADPLAATPYFILAQLAQIKGDINQTRECLNKTLYLDHRCVPAYLELAALYERDGNMPHAHILRQTALGILRSMPNDAMIEQYERTAGELAQWLEQWEPSAISHSNTDGNHVKGTQHGR